MTSSSAVRRLDISPSPRLAATVVSHTQPATETEAATYYPHFDWLRIALAGAVVLSHADILPGHSGNFAVQIFFALSGWLIGGILLRTPREGMARFYYLRATRIWIPYTVAFGILLLVSVLREPITQKYLEFVFYKATFVYNLFGTPQLLAARELMPLDGTGNHFWSICAEEQFYLFAPLLLVFVPRIGHRLWPWVLLMAIPQYGAISAGVLAAVAYRRYGAFHESPRARALLLAVAVVTTTSILTGITPYEHTVAPLAIAIVLLLARRGPKQRVAAFLGGVSYPLYLNHWVGLFVAQGVTKKLGVPELWGKLLFGLPLAFALSTVLYLAIDRAILARRNSWYSEALGVRLAVAAYGLTVVGLIGGALMYARA